jgi:hypothetical protein
VLLFITLKAYGTTVGRVVPKVKGCRLGAADTGHTRPHPTNTECEPISWRGTCGGSNINNWHLMLQKVKGPIPKQVLVTNSKTLPP